MRLNLFHRHQTFAITVVLDLATTCTIGRAKRRRMLFRYQCVRY